MLYQKKVMMLKNISVLLLVLFCLHTICAQEVVGSHEVTTGAEPNEFNIKTTVTSLIGADLARITYFIPNTHTYKASSNNRFFSKVEEGFIKFYIMSIPTNGTVVIELGLIVSEEGSFDFPVEFQYSKKEEKKVVKISSIKIEKGATIALVEPSLNDKIQEESKIAEDEEKKLEEERLEREGAELAAKIEKIKAIAEKEEKERVANEKAAAEKALAEQQVAEAEKLKKEEEATAIAKKEAEEEKVVTKEEQPSSGGKYGVQIFALSKYTEQKVRDFCKRNNLDYSKINTVQTKGITKVRYGSVNSKAEAETLKKDLLTRPQINGGFVVKL